jgi:hypothetical protein
VELLKSVPGFPDLVLKRYPWMRDEDGEQVGRSFLGVGAARRVPFGFSTGGNHVSRGVGFPNRARHVLASEWLLLH